MYYNEEWQLLDDDHLEVPDIWRFPPSKKDLRRLYYHEEPYEDEEWPTIPKQSDYLMFWADPAQMVNGIWTGHHDELDEHWDDYYDFVNSVSVWEDIEMCGEVAVESFLFGFFLGFLIKRGPGWRTPLFFGGLFTLPIFFLCPFSDDTEEDIIDEIEVREEDEDEQAEKAAKSGTGFRSDQAPEQLSEPQTLRESRFQASIRRRDRWWKKGRTERQARPLRWAKDLTGTPGDVWRDDVAPHDETSRYYGF